MASNKVYWLYWKARLDSDRVVQDSENPLSKRTMEERYGNLTRNGWQAWVEKNGVVVARNWEEE